MIFWEGINYSNRPDIFLQQPGSKMHHKYPDPQPEPLNVLQILCD